MRKKLLYVIIYIILGVAVWASNYSLVEKILVISIIMLLIFSIFVSSLVARRRGKVFVATVLLLCLAVRDIGVYFPWMYNYSHTLNMQSGFYGTQMSYTYNEGHSDMIIPTILKNKHVYIEEDNPFKEYIELVSGNTTAILKQQGERDTRIHKNNSMFIDFGRTSLDTAAYDLNLTEAEDYYNRGKERLGSDPHIYIESQEILDEGEVGLLVDEFCNFYIISIRGTTN